MSGFSFDANIIIDALLGYEPGQLELQRGSASGYRNSISRMTWVEVMSKGNGQRLRDTEYFLTSFLIEELDARIAARAAALRRDRPRLKSPDAIILATAQASGRVLVTRNTRDFSADMPGIRVPYSI